MITTKQVIKRYLPSASEISTTQELAEKIIKAADSFNELKIIRRGLVSIEKVMMEYKKVCTPEVIELVKDMLTDLMGKEKGEMYAGETKLYADWNHAIGDIARTLFRYGFLTAEEAGVEPDAVFYYRGMNSKIENIFSTVLGKTEAITEKELVKLVASEYGGYESQTKDELKHIFYADWQKVFKTKKAVKEYIVSLEATLEATEEIKETPTTEETAKVASKVDIKIEETKKEINELTNKLKKAYSTNTASKGIERSLSHKKSYLQALTDIKAIM